MNLEECYAEFGGSYEEVKTRIKRESLLERLVIQFLDDKTFDKLNEAMQNEDFAGVFEAAHTLKGICLNLSFKKLGASSSELTELLRKCDTQKVEREACYLLWQRLSKDYAEVARAVNRLKEDLKV